MAVFPDWHEAFRRAGRETPRRVGLLVGREESFPEALVAHVAAREAGVVCVYAEFAAPRADGKIPYEVIVDRISHEVVCYQPYLKLAALQGVRIVNNPFWRIADDKFFQVGLAARIGVKVPKTVLLPNKEYSADVNDASLQRNMRWVDWEAIAKELGFPVFLKPHWGGGWRDVTKCDDQTALWGAFDRSGPKTMILQEGIVWSQYVRCIVIGQKDVRTELWDPRLSHFDRYTKAHETMPPLEPGLHARVEKQALALTRALGYDMNTVEFAIKDGVPYAIDFMNSAPDLDVSSLGEATFGWAIEKVADLVISLAHEPPPPRARWDEVLGGPFR